MSKAKKATGSKRRRHQYPGWDLRHFYAQGRRFNQNGRALVWKFAQEVLGATDDERALYVGLDQRCISTCEHILRELGGRAYDALAEENPPAPYEAWKEFNYFKGRINKSDVSYNPNPQPAASDATDNKTETPEAAAA